MKRVRKTVCRAGLLALAALTMIPAALAQERIAIEHGFDALGFLSVPVNISGFSGEPLSVLRSDLLFMGIYTTNAEGAKYLISGSADSQVKGFLHDRVTRSQLLGHVYTGASVRSQIHTFADAIAQILLPKIPPIAQSRLAFKAEVARGHSEIYISDYDGFAPQPVTRDGTIVAAPCWAGRGMLFYCSYRSGRPDIYSHQLETGTRHSIAHFPGSNISPAVSPDGKKLAVILSKSGSPDLYVSELNGANLRQLTFTRESESSPCWSPDSQTICFVSRDRGTASMYTIGVNGGSMRRIPVDMPTPTEPDWSPDGKWIAFTSLKHEFEICIVKAQGGEAISLVPGEDPSWAPNSRAIVFCRGHDQAKRLFLLDVPTKHVKDVARILESNSQPSWAK